MSSPLMKWTFETNVSAGFVEMSFTRFTHITTSLRRGSCRNSGVSFDYYVVRYENGCHARQLSTSFETNRVCSDRRRGIHTLKNGCNQIVAKRVRLQYAETE